MSAPFWLVENGIPNSLEEKADGWVRSLLDELKNSPVVNSLPWVVVEVPRNHKKFVQFHRKKDNQKLPHMSFGARSDPLSDRMGDIITYILIAPSRRQVYRLARLNIPHYMVLHKHIVEFIHRIHDWHSTTGPNDYTDVGIKVHPSSGTVTTHWPDIDPLIEYSSEDVSPQLDSFSRVENFRGSDGNGAEISSLFCKLRVLACVYEGEGRPGGLDDKTRGNHGVDIGYTTTQAHEKDLSILDGLSLPSLTKFHTEKKTRKTKTHQRALELLVGFSEYVQTLEPDVYTDPQVPEALKNDRRCMTVKKLASRVVGGNCFPSARFIVARLRVVDGKFLDPHCDWPNCTLPKNSAVYGISEIFWHEALKCWLRVCLVVYSRASITSSLERYYRLYPILRRCREFVGRNEAYRVRRGREFISHVSEQVAAMTKEERKVGLVVMSPPHLDKMTFYDSIVDVVLRVSSVHGFEQEYCVSIILCTLASPNTNYIRSALQNHELVSDWCRQVDAKCNTRKERALSFGHLLFLHVYDSSHQESMAKSGNNLPQSMLGKMAGKCVHQSSNHQRMDFREFRRKFYTICKQWEYFGSTKYRNLKHKTTRGGIHLSATKVLNQLTGGKETKISSHTSCIHIVHLGALLQIYPLYFITWAVVPLQKAANITAKKVLEQYPNVYGEGSPTDRLRESFNLCFAVGFIAGGNANKGEQVICKTLKYPDEYSCFPELFPPHSEDNPTLELISYSGCRFGHNIYGVDGSLFDLFSSKDELKEFVRKELGREVEPDEYFQPVVKTVDCADGKLWDFYLIRRNMAGQLFKVDPVRAADPATRWNPWKVEVSGHNSRLLPKKRRLPIRIRCEGEESDSLSRNPSLARRKFAAVSDVEGGAVCTRTRSGSQACSRAHSGRKFWDSFPTIYDDDSSIEKGCGAGEAVSVSASDCAQEEPVSVNQGLASENEQSTGDTFQEESESGNEPLPCGPDKEKNLVPILLKRNLTSLLEGLLGGSYQELGGSSHCTPRSGRWGLAHVSIPGNYLGRGIPADRRSQTYWSTSIVRLNCEDWSPSIGICDCVPTGTRSEDSHVANQKRFFLSQETSRNYTLLNALLSLCETTTALEFLRPILMQVKFPTSFLCSGYQKEAAVYPPIHLDLGINSVEKVPDLVLDYCTRSAQPTVTVSCSHAESSFTKVYYLS